jgi:hypothetical protein
LTSLLLPANAVIRGRLFDNEIAHNSFGWKILPVSYSSSKIFREFPVNTMIPKDRGEGGTHLTKR